MNVQNSDFPIDREARRAPGRGWLLVALAAAALIAAASSPAGAAPSVGERSFIDSFVTIPTAVLDTVGALLPEESNGGASFLSDRYDPNIHLVEAATVSVTFVWEGAGYRNTLGYFTYDTADDGTTIIHDRQLIFPNVSLPRSGKLAPGDTVTLRDAAGKVRVFPPGTHIGFFLVADGFSLPEISQTWDAATAKIPHATAQGNHGTYKGVMTSIAALNPEVFLNDPDVSRHVAMINMEGIPDFLGGKSFLLLSFEDLNRHSGADNDFNDTVFFVSATPETAISTEDLPTVNALDPDPDGDGVVGTTDAYPKDPTRALVTPYPSRDFDVLGLEDYYPGIGDGDYNDAVVAVQYQIVTDASGKVKDILGTFHLLARGASFDHEFGVHLPTLLVGVDGTVVVDRYLEDDARTHQSEQYTIEELTSKRRQRVDVFPSTRAALPEVRDRRFVNTEGSTVDRKAASARFWISFDQAVPLAAIGSPPYDPYFIINGSNGVADVHLPGHRGFAERSSRFPQESGPGAFLDDHGYPWVISVPYGWRFPLENRRIDEAYDQFADWAASSGAKNQSWHASPRKELVSAERSDYLEARDWSVKLPNP